jgi:hypothetical protein
MIAKIATVKGMKEVKAYKTVSPSLFINREIPEGWWNISLTRSGLAIERGIRKLKTARKMAEIYAEVPGWDSIDNQWAGQYFRENNPAYWDAVEKARNIREGKEISVFAVRK